MGWCHYLKDTIELLSSAVCSARRFLSPLKTDDKVVVVGMNDEAECKREMFVTIRWEKTDLAVPLSLSKPVSSASEATKEAVEDWHYRVKRGYQVC